MSGLEVVEPIAVMTVRYLYNVAKKWWDKRKEKKELEENESALQKLMKEISDLKDHLEEKKKGREEISAEEVDLVRQNLAEVEHLGGVVKEDAPSQEALYSWVDREIDNLDVEESAEFYRYRLAIVIDKSIEEGWPRYRINKYKDLKSLIEVNLNNVIEARDRERTIPGAQGKVQAELYLKACLADAQEMLRKG